MPCNGFGHAPDCDCGWGGEFYGNEGFRYSLRHWQKTESHTNPNARCPNCGAKVYFYRSPDGGSVFFEELGSPWPKHECVHASQSQSKTSATLVVRRFPSWPFIWIEKWSLPENEGTALIDNDSRVLFVRTKSSRIPLWTPIWMSKHATEPAKYSVSVPRLKQEIVIESRYDAFSLTSFAIAEHARHFQATISLLNTGSNRHNYGDAGDS